MSSIAERIPPRPSGALAAAAFGLFFAWGVAMPTHMAGSSTTVLRFLPAIGAAFAVALLAVGALFDRMACGGALQNAGCAQDAREARANEADGRPTGSGAGAGAGAQGARGTRAARAARGGAAPRDGGEANGASAQAVGQSEAEHASARARTLTLGAYGATAALCCATSVLFAVSTSPSVRLAFCLAALLAGTFAIALWCCAILKLAPRALPLCPLACILAVCLAQVVVCALTTIAGVSLNAHETAKGAIICFSILPLLSATVLWRGLPGARRHGGANGHGDAADTGINASADANANAEANANANAKVYAKVYAKADASASAETEADCANPGLFAFAVVAGEDGRVGVLGIALLSVLSAVVSIMNGFAFAPHQFNLTSLSNASVMLLFALALVSLVPWTLLMRREKDAASVPWRFSEQVFGGGIVIAAIAGVILLAVNASGVQFFSRALIDAARLGLLALGVPMAFQLVQRKQAAFPWLAFALLALGCVWGRSAGIEIRHVFGYDFMLMGPLCALAIALLSVSFFGMLVRASRHSANQAAQHREELESREQDALRSVSVSDAREIVTNAHREALQAYDLSPRETDVALVIMEGCTVAVAAEKLDITQATVKYHLSHIYEKTDCDSKGDLVQLGAEAAAAAGEQAGAKSDVSKGTVQHDEE